MRRKLVLIGAVMMVVASCAGETGDGIEIRDAWARTSAAMASAGAVYMQIHNPLTTDDTLLGAAADPSVASRVEIHETAPMDSTTTMAGGSTMGGMMTMRPVDRIAVPAGQTVSLEPGGYHVMLIDLAQPLESGTTITITLTFEEAGNIEVEADVRDTAP